MADTKENFQWLDIPDGQGGYERKWCKDAEARAAIESLDPASAASDTTCEDIVDDIVDGTHKIQGHETEVIPVSGLKAALDKYKTDVVDEGLSGKQDTISDLATIRSGASAGATAYQKPSTGIPSSDMASAVQTSLGKADTAVQPSALATVATSGSYNDLSNKPVFASTTTCQDIIDELT